MSNFDVSTLKLEQTKRISLKTDLLEQCIPFRDGFLERLERFTHDAIEGGVDGVSHCRRKVHTNKILEVNLTLNGVDVAFIATDDVFPIDADSEAVASRMFIYFDGDDENTPHIEIVVLGPHEGMYMYKMVWFAQGQPALIAEGRSVTRQDGHAAAEALLNHFYGFRTLWAERPTLGMVRERKYERRAMGFQAVSD